jgi:hypothetical protein
MVDEPDELTRRRRRRRATRDQGAPSAYSSATDAPPAEPPGVEAGSEAGSEAEAEPSVRSDDAAAPRRRRPPRDGGERGLRDIVGAGRSQLGVSGALRARDVNRPTDDDLAEAERDVAIIRRNWRPDDNAP